jgi:hypothetical protein
MNNDAFTKSMNQSASLNQFIGESSSPFKTMSEFRKEVISKKKMLNSPSKSQELTSPLKNEQQKGVDFFGNKKEYDISLEKAFADSSLIELSHAPNH